MYGSSTAALFPNTGTLTELPLSGDLVLPVAFLVFGDFQVPVSHKNVKENVAPRLSSRWLPFSS